MKKLLMIIAALEILTGIIVLAIPEVAVRALLGVEVQGAGIIMSRIAGVALIGLGVACWPGNSSRQQIYGMLTYSILVWLYLIRIGIRGVPVGLLLWPAVAAHAVLIIVLVVAGVRAHKPTSE
jgi:hypothetical protein